MEVEHLTPLIAIALRLVFVLAALLCIVSLSRSAWNALLEPRREP